MLYNTVLFVGLLMIAAVSSTPRRITPVKNIPIGIEDIDKFEIISRRGWGGQKPSLHAINPLRIGPAHYVMISYTKITPQCHGEAKCWEDVQNTETIVMAQYKWTDIGYNFLIGSDGKIYEGRGWNFPNCSRDRSRRCVVIGLVGWPANVESNKKQIRIAQQFLESAMKEGQLDYDYQLIGYCPTGSEFESDPYKILQTWPHWAGQALMDIELLVLRY